MDEIDLAQINFFEIEDGEFIIIQQNCLHNDERSAELDEIIMSREAALKLAYKIINALEDV